MIDNQRNHLYLAFNYGEFAIIKMSGWLEYSLQFQLFIKN